MSSLRSFAAGDWGRLRVGQVDVPTRALVAVAGVVLWLLICVFLTSLDDTFTAFATNAGFIVGVVLIASLTRTIGIVTITRAFLLGAMAMAAMLLLAGPLEALSRNPVPTVDPPAEELLKLVPLAIILWQARRISVWQFSATDFLLICAAAGAGFAVVEDAYIRMASGWGDSIPLLPTTEIYEDRLVGTRIIAGHSLWTALAGITLGIAWLMSHIKAFWLIAPVGFLIGTADHLAVNNEGKFPELGVLVIVLFVAGVIGTVALDFYVLRRKLPSVPELDSAMVASGPPQQRWRRMVVTRRLRFASWRFAPRSAKSTKAELAVEQSVTELVGDANPSA